MLGRGAPATRAGADVVAVLVALVVDRAARLAERSARARTGATPLASYARTMLTSPSPLTRLLGKVRENSGLESTALLERRVACVGPGPCDEPDEADIDVPVTADVHSALRGRTLPASDQRALEAAAGQALLALRRQRTARQTTEAQQRAEVTELRTAVLSAVGHDPRTPLTSIKTAIDNLLDSSRLATGAVAPLLSPATHDEVVARALTGIDERRLVVLDVPETPLPVLTDVGLPERVVTDDAPGIAVRAGTRGDHVEPRVVDHGQRLSRDTAFAPFQHLDDRDKTPGVGLGLSVAKGFTGAMGGTTTTEDTPGGGLTIVISLPVAARTDQAAQA